VSEREQQRLEVKAEKERRMERELDDLEQTCPHIEVFGHCNYREQCRNKFIRVRKLPTILS